MVFIFLIFILSILGIKRKLFCHKKMKIAFKLSAWLISIGVFFTAYFRNFLKKFRSICIVILSSLASQNKKKVIFNSIIQGVKSPYMCILKKQSKVVN